MDDLQPRVMFACRPVVAAVVAALLLASGGCAPSYRQLRFEGQTVMLKGDYGAARQLFVRADSASPQRIENLHDMGVCSVVLAKQKFEQRNHAAALREVDAAIGYYDRAIATHPGNQACLEGKNIALELKGQFDAALKHAEWATRFVGPSAKQQVFLANELEERGDFDGALLRFRQAVAMEPKNPTAHIALAEYLFRRDNDPQAVKHLQIAYRLDPFNREVANMLIGRHALPPLPEKTTVKP